MARYYGHRITKRERDAVNALYAPRAYRLNERNVFSHSEQCDQFFSFPVVTHPGTGNLLAGFESKHSGCRCWCHNAQYLSDTPEPEFDLTPPPEYAGTADAVFFDTPLGACPETTGDINYLTQQTEPVLGEPATCFEPEISPVKDYWPELPAGYEGEDVSGRFPNRTPQEIARNKCDTCGDTLAACECVE